MSIHFTDKEFNCIESAIQDTIRDDEWFMYADEQDEPEEFLNSVTRNDDGSVEVPDNVIPMLAGILRELHHAYAEAVLAVGWECEHDNILIDDFMEDFDCICHATSILMRNPEYIHLMNSYRKSHPMHRMRERQ